MIWSKGFIKVDSNEYLIRANDYPAKDIEVFYKGKKVEGVIALIGLVSHCIIGKKE